MVILLSFSLSLIMLSLIGLLLLFATQQCCATPTPIKHHKLQLAFRVLIIVGLLLEFVFTLFQFQFQLQTETETETELVSPPSAISLACNWFSLIYLLIVGYLAVSIHRRNDIYYSTVQFAIRIHLTLRSLSLSLTHTHTHSISVSIS